MTPARAFALFATVALLLGGCHQRKEGAGALDAGADARARTAAKTLADLRAAEQAGGAPLPAAPAERVPRVAPAAAPSPDTPVADEVPGEPGSNQTVPND